MLSKKDRIEILDLAIKLLIDGRNSFMCTAIEHATALLKSMDIIALREFPELLKYKPQGIIGDAWFYAEETEIRIHILKDMKHGIESN